MNKQIKCKFQEVRAKRTVVTEARASRYNNQTLDDFDEEAYNVETTDIKRTSRYHMEDCLKMHHGDAIMLYFRCNAKSTMQNVFSEKPPRTAEMQLKQGIGADVISINAKKFVALKATISRSTLHHDIKYVNLTPAQFKRAFNGNQGFGIQFLGTSIKIAFHWKQLIQYSEDVYVYGPPFDGAKKYDLLFRGKTDTTKLKTIFYEMSKEMTGDFYASSALMTAYSNQMRTAAEEKLAQMERNKDKIDDLLSFNETTKSESFFNCFGNMCKNAFKSKVVKFTDHNKPIIERECFDVYVEAAEWCFP